MAGIIGKKIGMTRIFDDEGAAVSVTVVEAGPCPVLQLKSAETDGYTAVQLGFGAQKDKRANKAEKGHAAKAGVEVTPRVVREFELSEGDEYELGASDHRRSLRGRRQRESDRNHEGEGIPGCGEALWLCGPSGFTRASDVANPGVDRARYRSVPGDQGQETSGPDGWGSCHPPECESREGGSGTESPLHQGWGAGVQKQLSVDPEVTHA